MKDWKINSASSRTVFDFEKMRKNAKELEGEVVRSDFWKDAGGARKVNEELYDLRESLEFWGGVENEISDLRELGGLSNISGDILKEIEAKIKEIDGKISKQEIDIFLSGRNDKDDALVSIHAGAGGVDAQDWSEMLLKMYLKYFENKGFKAKILNISSGEGAGIKSADIEVRGKYAYGYLKGEVGIHRLVRLSPFNSQHLRHTSFAKLEVLPIYKDLRNIEIKPEDIKIDTYKASGPGGQYVNKTESAVRIHHLPTGIVALSQSERSQTQNREKAMELLKLKILRKKSEEEEKEKSRLRESAGKAEWSYQIRSYILHPYKMAKDHRTGVETSGVEELLNDGKLDEFIEAELKFLKPKI